MGALEEQARFLTAKYGTAAGPTGLPRTTASVPDIALLMVILGLVIFGLLVYALAKDYYHMQQTAKAIRRERFL
jgi:hypothetical protein